MLQEPSQLRGNRVLLGKGKGGRQVSCCLVLATALVPVPKHGASREGRAGVPSRVGPPAKRQRPLPGRQVRMD